MKNQRPKNLNLFTIQFPLPAIVSILHRISGVILFLFIPLVLWTLNSSLSSAQEFDNLHEIFQTPWIKFITWGCLSAFLYHLVAGLRHVLMSFGIGEELKSGRLSSKLTFLISAILIILTGVWLW